MAKYARMREMPSSVDKQSTVCQYTDRGHGAWACVQVRKHTWHALEEAHVEAELIPLDRLLTFNTLKLVIAMSQGIRMCGVLPGTPSVSCLLLSSGPSQV